jgi:hypothetical protein
MSKNNLLIILLLQAEKEIHILMANCMFKMKMDIDCFARLDKFPWSSLSPAFVGVFLFSQLLVQVLLAKLLTERY